MYQSQQFHTSNYRGNQPGHDTYLRADSQSPSSFGTQNVTSQYRGLQKSFQPTGFVSSVYGQSNTGYSQNQPFSSNLSSYGSSTGTQNYHTANYRGNQQGHDNYLRADSTQPAQSQFGVSNIGSTGYSSSFNNYNTGSFQGTGVSSFNQNQQFVSPESYHTANYRGNQQGHDNYLRADSTQPAQGQFGLSSAGTTFGNVSTSGYNNPNANISTYTFGGSSIGSSTPGVSSFGTSNYNNNQSFIPSGIGSSSFGSTSSYNNQNQFVSPESYHTANYKGNQQGHDNYLRADSTQPAQSQFGTGYGSFNTGNRF